MTKSKKNNKQGVKEVVVVTTTAKPRKAKANSKPRSSSVTALTKAVKKMGVKLSGRGGYFADAGSNLGSNAGSLIGGTAGQYLDNILGRGKYTIKKNSIMTLSEGIPTFNAPAGKDYVEIEHKEFVCDVIANNTQSWAILNVYPLQPGNSKTFPYASCLAPNFEQWELVGAVWVYEPTSGSITTTQGLGSIQIATQYDAADPAFQSQVEMLDYEYSDSCSPDKGMLHPVECSPRLNSMTRMYVRTTPQANIQMFDLGNTSIALAGCSAAAGVVLGKMWLTYKLRLYKPKIYASLVGDTVGYIHWSTTGSSILTAAQPFGATTLAPVSSFGSLAANSEGQNRTTGIGTHICTFGPTLPAGGSVRVFVIILGSGAASAAAAPTIGTFVNCQVNTTTMYNGQAAAYALSAATAGAQTELIYTVDLVLGTQYNYQGNSACQFSLTFANNGIPTGTQALDVFIMQIPSAAT
jgi:hypothetical protein